MASSPKLHLWIVLCVNALFFQVTFSDCPSNWLTIKTGSVPATTCYKVFSTPTLSFNASADYCRNQGGYLARDTSQTVHNNLKPNVLSAAVRRRNRFWIGLTDNNQNGGPWVWIDGPNLGSFQQFTTISVNKIPNRLDCAYATVVRNDFKWQVTSNCGSTSGFICQRDSTAAIVSTTTAQPLNCSSGWYGFPSQHWCIKLFSNPLPWTNARQQCMQNRADLVRINNTLLNSFVNSIIGMNRGVYWIGLNDRANEGTFKWLDDTSKATFTNWISGMPNNYGGNENCVFADGNKNNKWDDLDCSTPNRFICQKASFSGFPHRSPGPTPKHQNCGFGWEDVTDSDTCISFNTNVLTWLDARADCQTRGGDLASIASIQEQTYLSARSLTLASDSFWIGANDRSTENGWQWTDGTPFAFLNWDAGQPDNSHDSDCTVMSQRNGRWEDVPCQSRNGYICKKKGAVTFTSLVTTSTPPPHLTGNSVFGCPRGWDNYRGSCYKMVQLATGVNWATASAACAGPTMQGALAAIIDADENKFIFSLLPRGYRDFAWIGLEDPTENTFTWVDNTPVQYTNWEPGEPNNANDEDCVVMKGDNGKWNDAQCANAYTVYICKKNKSIQPKGGSPEEQGCSSGSVGYGALCYTFISTGKTFSAAQSDCKARFQNQGNLATIDSGHLEAFLTAEMQMLPSNTYWIGLKQNNLVYAWQSNYLVSYTNWGVNHTGNERSTCVAMQKTGLWANYGCNVGSISYICESPRTGFTTPTTKAPVTSLLPCPKGWTGYGNLCYNVFSKNMSDMQTWGDARDFCARQADGGSLLTINDNATQVWLVTNIIQKANASGDYWIGLNDRESESGYVWEDNSPYLYANWGAGEPNDAQNKEDCVEWVLPQNYWNDEYCYVSKNWICQVPRGSQITTPKPTPTGVYSADCGNSSWLEFNNYCYFVSAPDGDSSTATWFDARRICMSLGGDLASIRGDDENGLVTSLISKNPTNTFWIGLNDLDADSYGWTDLNPVSYVNWALNEPNDNYGGERCVEMTSGGFWNDLQCQSQLGFVCKKMAGNAVTAPFIPVPPQGGCPRGFVSLPSLSFCYAVGGTTNSTRSNYDDAIKGCELMVHKSTLASVHSSLEEKFILILISSLRTPAWIGFNDRRIRNQFEWVDNLVVTYTKWGRGQPDENLNDNRPDARRDCVDIEIRRGREGWNDRQCNIPLAYVCESRKGPTFPTAAPNTTGCHTGYQRFRNSCYKYYKDMDNWALAESICKGDGGNLATLSSGMEQAFVEIMTGHYNDSLQFWLGLTYNQVSAAFSWADSWPVRFTNWGHGEPNTKGGQTCVTHMVDAQWQVVNCSTRHPFVCEINLGGPPPTRTYNGGRCPRNWFPFNGNCYHLETSSPKSWAGANAACTSMGGNLASIHSDVEARTLTNYIGNIGTDVWIGLFKGQGTGFSWFDGTQLEYLNWAVGEPNDPDSFLHQDCVKIQNHDAAWADTDCYDQNAYICKRGQVYPIVTDQQGHVVTTVYPIVTDQQGHVVTTSAGQSGQAQTGGSSGLSGGSVAGIVIGTIVLGVLAAVIGFLLFRRYRAGNVSPIIKQQLTSEEGGFENASYSSGGVVKVNSSSDA